MPWWLISRHLSRTCLKIYFRHCEEGALCPTTLAPHCARCSAGEQSNHWHIKLFIMRLLRRQNPAARNPGEGSRGNDGIRLTLRVQIGVEWQQLLQPSPARVSCTAC